eukprot:72859-Chlamydomonas_euryale.AAC.13
MKPALPNPSSRPRYLHKHQHLPVCIFPCPNLALEPTLPTAPRRCAAFVPTSVVGMLVGAGVTFGLERSDVDLRKAGQALCEGVSAAVEKLPTITDHLPELEASSQ